MQRCPLGECLVFRRPSAGARGGAARCASRSVAGGAPVPSPGESDQVNVGDFLPVWVSEAAVERDGLNDMGRARAAVHGPDTIEEAVQERSGGGPGYRGADVSFREQIG